jgi:hypothetical protein
MDGYIEMIRTRDNTVGKSLLALELLQTLLTSARLGWTWWTYRGGDGSVVRRGALSGEVHAIGSLELDLESGCRYVSGCAQRPMDVSDLRQCGRSPC